MKVLHIGWGFTPWRPGGLIQYAEDLMHAQLALGHEVAYFFAGRHYPFTPQPRLERWFRSGVHMFELLNSELAHAGELGTLDPKREISEPTSEQAFEDVLNECRPDLVHIQELAGLPSSLIEVAKARALPIVMTLQDYFLLCPTLKLLDYEGKICLGKDVGDRCRACCAKAPVDRSHLVDATLRYEIDKHLKSGIWRNAGRSIIKAKSLARRGQRLVSLSNSSGKGGPGSGPRSMSADAYQQRRNINVNRLNMADVLIGQSQRVTEIYRSFGIRPEKIMTLQLTLGHLSQIQPILQATRSGPVAFGTLNGCASFAKGARLLFEALCKLREWGLSAKFRLIVLGGLDRGLRQDFLRFNNVVYQGHYDRNDLNRLLGQIRVGIIPSIWEEAYGYVGVEFLAKGIPVIGNRIGGIVDYVWQGKTGWLNADNTGTGLANIMASLIRSPEQISTMNRNIVANRAQIVKTMDAHVYEIDAIYRQVITSKNSSPVA